MNNMQDFSALISFFFHVIFYNPSSVKCLIIKYCNHSIRMYKHYLINASKYIIQTLNCQTEDIKSSGLILRNCWAPAHIL